MTLIDFLNNLGVAVFVAVLSSYLTFRLAAKRFQSERWWELKLKAYQAIIDAIHEMKRVYEKQYTYEIEYRKFSDEEKNENNIIVRNAYLKILKAMDTGAFIISDEAVNRLKKYRDATDDDHMMWLDHIEKEQHELSECLKDIIIIAKKDLSLN